MLLLLKGNAIPWPSTDPRQARKWQWKNRYFFYIWSDWTDRIRQVANWYHYHPRELSDGISIYQSFCIKKVMQQLSFRYLSSHKLMPLLTVVTDFSDAKSLRWLSQSALVGLLLGRFPEVQWILLNYFHVEFSILNHCTVLYLSQKLISF